MVSIAMTNSKPRIIVATVGTGGDIQPFVTLAQGLSGRGHQVLMLVPEFHASFVESQGLEYKSVGTVSEFQAVLENPDLWNERKGLGVVWKGLEPYLGAVRELVDQQPKDAPCLVLCNSLLVPMADIARYSRPDLRIVCGHLAPFNLCSSYDGLSLGSIRIPRRMPLSWRQALWGLIFKAAVDPVMLPSLNAFRTANHLPPLSGFIDHILNVPDASIGLFPNWFASVQPDWPSSFIESDFPFTPVAPTASLSPQLEHFLSAGEAPIAFTPGTGHRHASRYFAVALKALERLGRRGLLITSFAEQIPRDLPPGVMWIPHAPFNLLLRRLVALVHHGGIGTTAEAFRSGIPQLIVPFAFDQFDNGSRARRLGVAEMLLTWQMTPRRLADRLTRLLSSAVVSRSCAKVAELAQRPAQSSLVECLEEALSINEGA